MATIVDQLITEYRMKNSQYLQGASQVKAATKDTGSAMDAAMRSIGGNGMGGALSRLMPSLTAATAGVGALGVAAGVATAGIAAAGLAVVALGAAYAKLFQFAYTAFEKFAPFDSLVKSLESVEGSARAANIAMKELQRISKAPGIGFQESVAAYTGLRNSGVGQGMSYGLIEGVANANARGGGDIMRFERAMMAIRQIAQKEYLQGEELLQLMEAGIPVQGMVKNAFGTSDTEELKKKGVTSAMVLAALNQELAKLPRVAGGAQNAIDNLGSAVNMAWVSLGAGVASSIVAFMEPITAEIERFTSAGVFKMLGESIGAFLDVGVDSETIFVNAAAAAMTFLDIMTIFKDTIVSLANSVITFINESAIGKFIKMITGAALTPIALKAIGFDIGDQFSNNKSTIEQMLTLADKKAAKESSKKASEVAKETIKAEETKPAAPGSPEEITARNTSRLVDLQQKQLDFQRALMGGGQVAQESLSGINVERAGGNINNAKIAKGVQLIMDGISGGFGSQIGVKRGYGYRS